MLEQALLLSQILRRHGLIEANGVRPGVFDITSLLRLSPLRLGYDPIGADNSGHPWVNTYLRSSDIGYSVYSLSHAHIAYAPVAGCRFQVYHDLSNG